ncbi:hypothetical protein Tco_0903212, partial [Tanacetum coccineum]
MPHFDCSLGCLSGCGQGACSGAVGVCSRGEFSDLVACVGSVGTIKGGHDMNLGWRYGAMRCGLQIQCLRTADEAGKSKSSSEVVTKEASTEIGKEKLVVINVSSSSSANVISLEKRRLGAFINDEEETSPMKKVNTNSGPLPLFAMEATYREFTIKNLVVREIKPSRDDIKLTTKEVVFTKPTT